MAAVIAEVGDVFDLSAVHVKTDVVIVFRNDAITAMNQHVFDTVSDDGVGLYCRLLMKQFEIIRSKARQLLAFH